MFPIYLTPKLLKAAIRLFIATLVAEFFHILHSDTGLSTLNFFSKIKQPRVSTLF